MVTILLVITDPTLRQTVALAFNAADTVSDGYHVIHSDSLQAASLIASRRAAVVVLFDIMNADNQLHSNLRQLRSSAPACIISALSASRKFYYDEVRALQKAGAHFTLEESAVTIRANLLSAVKKFVDILSASKVLARLTPKLPPVALRAARIVLTDVCNPAGDTPSAPSLRMRRIRDELGSRPHVPAERFDVAMRLLLLIELIETCQQPVSQLFALAGFPSANDARELLRSYAMVESRDLRSADGCEKARARLKQILLGNAIPERRRTTRHAANAPESGIRNQESGIRNQESGTRRRASLTRCKSAMQIE